MLGWPFSSLAGAETVTKALRLKNSGSLKRLLYHTTCSWYIWPFFKRVRSTGTRRVKAFYSYAKSWGVLWKLANREKVEYLVLYLFRFGKNLYSSFGLCFHLSRNFHVLLNKAVVFFGSKPHGRRFRFSCQESSLQTYPCGEFCSFLNKTSPVNMH